MDGPQANFIAPPSHTLVAGAFRDGRAVAIDPPAEPDVEARLVLRDGLVHIATVTVLDGTMAGIPQVVADAVPALLDVDRARVSVCEPHPVHPSACVRRTNPREPVLLDGIVPLQSE